MDLGLRGQHALVLGASGGIGTAVMSCLAAEGMAVVGAGRETVAVERSKGDLGDAFRGAVRIDLTDPASIESGLDDCYRLIPDIDLLVCSAARSHFASVWDYSRADWELDVITKFVGTADLTRKVAASMVERRSGAIVILTGIASHLVMNSNPAGGAANAALECFVRVLSAEVADRGVRVVGISPGMTQTDRLTTFARGAESAIAAGIPMRRLAEPAEVARMVAFAGSPAASYLTGTTIVLDGGMSSRHQRSPARPQPAGGGSSQGG